jgi:acetyl-CoA carboxylase carboxyltransferase component
MVDKTANMFITGPQVIKAVTGEDVSAEALGGATVHNSVSGCASLMFHDEPSTIAGIKKLLSYLPSNNTGKAPVYETQDPVTRECLEIAEIIPDSNKKPYDIRDIIKSIFDYGDYFEIQPFYAINIVTCFARLNGTSVGIIANQPMAMAGVLDINASDKASRFIRFCDSFNIPLVTFTDTSGYLPGTAQEHGGIIRHGAKLLYAYSEATVPKITIIVRKAYGGAYIAMCSRHLGADQVFAYPTAEIAVMGPEGAANIIYKKDIDEAADPAAMRTEKVEEYKRKFGNPYIAAARGYIDDVIDPAASRSKLAWSLYMLKDKRESHPAKKHGNMPV